MPDDAQAQVLTDEWIEAGWDAWDIEDAYLVIDDALQYLDENDSI